MRPKRISSSESPTREHGYRMYFSRSVDPHIVFDLHSGSTVVSVSAAFLVQKNKWTNIGVIYDKPDNLLYMYLSGNLIASSSCELNSIEFSPRVIYIGSGTLGDADENNQLYTGSLNEIRIFHTASKKYHKRNYCQPVNSEDFVKLYYTFNEGIVGTASIDTTVVDYSKNSIHGLIQNYNNTVRVSGNVMPYDPGNVILYSFHSAVISFTSSYVNSGSDYDKKNKSFIERLVAPDVVYQDEQEEGLLKTFLYGMASFFDELKLYVDQFDNLRITNYDGYNETPDQILPYLKRYFGWKITNNFGDSNPLEFILGENIIDSGSLSTNFTEIRNQFWRRILNNISYIYKSKGKRYAIDSFMNSIGINPNLYKIKEYGYLNSTSIQNQRVRREKDVPVLGFGTGSISSSYVAIPDVFDSSKTEYTIESLVQLPYASASYSGSVLINSGAIWQLVDKQQLTGSVALLWTTETTGSISGSLLLTGSDGQSLSSKTLSIFDGDFVHIAAGLNSTSKPFIEVRTIDNDEVDFSASFVGPIAFSGVFSGSNYDLVIGANSGSTYHSHNTHCYIGEVRAWNVKLSSSELEDHALHFESIGLKDPLSTNQLIGHWPLNENTSSDTNGNIYVLDDYSRNNLWGIGSGFEVSKNPYKRHLLEYNFLSPSYDTGWGENKVRVRNLTHLKRGDVSRDSNRVALEFNLVDSLNEDMSKLFSSFEILDKAIGNPVNKYRDEYANLERYRKDYFERLGDSINFISFFDAFKWFDRKLGEAIKQLLPANSVFVGGEQVVESHMFERPRYKYRYNIFKTPKDINEGEISGTFAIMSGDDIKSIEIGEAKSTFASKKQEENTTYSSLVGNVNKVSSRNITHNVNGDIDKIFYNFKCYFGDGEEIVDKIPYTDYNFEKINITLTGNSVINDIAIDSSNRIYSVGRKGNNWVVYRSHISQSDSWEEIESYSSIPSTSNEAKGISIDSNDNLYVCGYGGASFKEDVFFSGTTINDLAFDSSGAIYAVGSFNSSSGGTDRSEWWVVKSHITESDSWEEVDRFNNYTSYSDEANAIAIDNDDIIYVAGFASSGSVGNTSWCVRSSSDYGANWGLSDLHNAVHGGYDRATGIACDSTGKVFAVGYVSESSPQDIFRMWIVRSSSDRGDNWGKCDSYSGPDVWEDAPFDIAIDSSDVIYVAGYEGYGGRNPLVRRSTDGGNSWNNVFSETGGGGWRNLIQSIDTNSSDEVYFGATRQSKWEIYSSSDGTSGSFTLSERYDCGDLENATGIFCSASDLYVLGDLTASSKDSKWFVRKYDSSKHTWGMIDYFNSVVGAKKIRLDVSGGFYVCGSTGSVGIIKKYNLGSGQTIGKSAVVGKYSGANWTYDVYNMFSSGNDVFNDVEVDSSDLAYAVGYISSSTNSNQNWVVFSCSTSQDSHTWKIVDEYSSGGTEEAKAINIKGGDLIEVVGHETVADFGTNLLIRSSSDGAIWATTDASCSYAVTGALDSFSDIDTDSAGYSYVVGYYSGSNGSTDWLIRKTTTHLSDSWTNFRSFDYEDLSIEDKPRGIFINSGSNNYMVVVGSISSSVGEFGYIERSMDSGSNWEVVDLFGDNLSASIAYATTIDTEGNIYVVGSSGSSGSIAVYKVLQNPGFYRTQYGGDTQYDSFNANTSLNFKNEWAKRQLRDWELKKYPNAQHSGVFMNSKFGDSFIIKSLDTSKDSIHFNGGHKRNVKWTIRGLSGSYDVNSGSLIILTGANGIDLSQSLFHTDLHMDVGNIDYQRIVEKATGVSLSTPIFAYDPKLTLYVSGVNTNFDKSKVKLFFKDENSDGWSDQEDITTKFGNWMSESSPRTGKLTGWIKYEYNFVSGSEISMPKFALNKEKVIFTLSATQASEIYAFKDIKLEFNVPLANVGLEYYRDLHNQNIEEKWINRDVIKKIED